MTGSYQDPTQRCFNGSSTLVRDCDRMTTVDIPAGAGMGRPVHRVGPEDYPAASDWTWCRAAGPNLGVHGVDGISHRASHDVGTREPIRMEQRCP